MTYEEKLQKILDKLKEERNLTRKNHKTTVIFNDSSFTKIHIGDVCKILLQLQDDEKALIILDALQPSETVSTEQIIAPSADDNYEGVVIIGVELDEPFDQWYNNYLVKQRSTLAEMTYLNLLRILHTILDVRELVQLNKDLTVIIPILPQRIRFRELMLMDDAGQRDEFMQGRWDSLGYLKKEGIIKDFRLIDAMMHRWDNSVEVTIVPEPFYSFYEKVKQEVSKRVETKEQQDTDQVDENHIAAETKIVWPDDFKWEGKDFVFGQYGSINFTSDDRLFILKTLADKKGSWATIKELKGKKDAGYVRSTIKQIEDRLPQEAKEHITIVSTQDDESKEKHSIGAYRIKVTL